MLGEEIPSSHEQKKNPYKFVCEFKHKVINHQVLSLIQSLRKELQYNKNRETFHQSAYVKFMKYHFEHKDRHLSFL